MLNSRKSRRRVVLSAAIAATFLTVSGGGLSAFADTSLSTSPVSVAVGSAPTGMAYSPDGDTLFVANMGGASVSEVSTATGQVTHTIAVSSNAGAIVTVAPNGRYAYVASWADGKLNTIDTATHTETATESNLPNAMDVEVSPDSNTVYVADYGSGEVSVFAANNGHPTLTHTITVGSQPSSLAISPDGSRLYVVNNGSGTVSVIDTATNSVLVGSELTTNSSPWAVSISPNAQYLAVSHDGGNGIKIFDLVHGTSSTVSLSERSFSVWFGGTSQRLYATEFDSSRVSTIDLTNSNAVTSLIPSGASGMRDVVMSPDGCQLSAAGQNTSTVYFLNVSPCEPNAGLGVIDDEASATSEAEGSLANTGTDSLAGFATVAGALALLMAGVSLLLLRRRA